MYEDDIGYAQTRLNKSYVRNQKGEVIYVEGVGGDGSIVTVETEDEVFRHSTLAEIDHTPISLGFINAGDKVFYLQRVPIRGGGYKQGLHPGNCKTTEIKKGESYDHRALPPMKYMLSPRTYIPFRNALGRRTTTAFHKDFALSWDGTCHLLMYKTNCIGKCKGAEIHLDEKYTFMQDYVNEVVNG